MMSELKYFFLKKNIVGLKSNTTALVTCLEMRARARVCVCVCECTRVHVNMYIYIYALFIYTRSTYKYVSN